MGSPNANKKAAAAADIPPEIPVPPETFDEARTFMKVTFSLEKPLLPRKTPLTVEDVLPAGRTAHEAACAPKVTHPISKSVASVEAGVRIERDARALLAEPKRIERSAAASTPATPAVDDGLSEFRTAVRDMVHRMVAEFENSTASEHASYEQPALTARGHALPPGQNAALPVAATQLSALLSTSSLSLHFLSALKPQLTALIEARFHAPLSSASGVGVDETKPAHSRNELYSLLSNEAVAVLRETVRARGGAGPSAQAQKDADTEATLKHEKLGRLAAYAEQHNDLRLADFHHLTRLTSIHSYLSSSPASSSSGRSLVQAWYDYGCFLLRLQNGPEDLASPDAVDVERPGKTGRTVQGGDAAIDVAEECMRQCLKYDHRYVPALLALALIHLEQGCIESALAYIHHTLHAYPGHHALLLAAQGLYHELAEEDVEAAGAYHRAGEVMHEYLNSAGSANGSDPLLQAMLGTHGRGCYSLPLFHSQTIPLLLARFLSSLGFRRLTYRVLRRQVNETNRKMALESQAEADNQFAEDEAELNANDTTQFHIGRFDYYHWGPYLELAQWHAASPAMYASHALPLLKQAQQVIESKTVDQHHSHSLMYAFATQGNIHYANKRYEDAAQNYMAYLSMMDEKKMNVFLDPLVLCHAASLYLLQHILSTALSLSSLLVTHPFHQGDPFLWCLYGEVSSSMGRHDVAEEALSEALAKDQNNSRAWASLAANGLRRIAQETHRKNRSTSGKAVVRPDPAALVEVHHAFQKSIYSPAPVSDARQLVELARLFFSAHLSEEAEQCYTRALILDPTDASGLGAAKKLEWLQQQKDGTLREQEARAAQTIGRVLKGAHARKETKQLKLRAAQRAAAEEEF